jgi:hypothetical protein
MQISKKLYTSLIITVLALSTIVAAIPMVSAAIDGDPILSEPGIPGNVVLNAQVGDKVQVNGLGATQGAASPYSTVTVYWFTDGTVLGTTTADGSGLWALNVTIPSAVEGVHEIVANDGGGADGVAVDIDPKVEADVTRALPGDSILLTGHGYDANSAVTVEFDNGIHAPWVITAPAITTNGTGSFEATVVVPAAITVADYGTFDIIATDAGTNTATETIEIDYYILLTPKSGPRGITATFAGRIPANTPYSIEFNFASITTGTSAADGSYSFAYTIPSILSTTGYDVRVVYQTTEFRADTFTVSADPIITATPNNGVAGDVIGLTGSGFSSLAGVSLYIGSTMVNGTTMDSNFGPTSFFGALTGLTFVVPTMAPGVYSIYVQDDYGASSTSAYYFTINPTPVFEAYTRAVEYTQGDVISVYTYATSNPAVTMMITDPNGMEFSRQSLSGWVLSAGIYYIPNGLYDLGNLTLPADAPIGTWNFTCWSAGAIVDTNLFTVAAPSTLDDVMDGIDEVKDQLDDMTDMIDSIDGDVVTIKGDTASIENLMNSLDLSAVSALATDVGTLQMTVEALAATVTSIDDGVATVETTLGTLQGTITSVEGDVATIQTDVGTLEADISDVKANVDNTPAWIAVVLALVAAVAAIFAVITIRQKIAG